MKVFIKKKKLLIIIFCLNCLSYRVRYNNFYMFPVLNRGWICFECMNFYKSIFSTSRDGYHVAITKPSYLSLGEGLLITEFGIRIWIRLGTKSSTFFLKWVLESHSYSELFIIHTSGNRGSFRAKVLHHLPWWRATIIKTVYMVSLRQHCFSEETELHFIHCA